MMSEVHSQADSGSTVTQQQLRHYCTSITACWVTAPVMSSAAQDGCCWHMVRSAIRGRGGHLAHAVGLDVGAVHGLRQALVEAAVQAGRAEHQLPVEARLRLQQDTRGSCQWPWHAHEYSPHPCYQVDIRCGHQQYTCTCPIKKHARQSHRHPTAEQHQEPCTGKRQRARREPAWQQTEGHPVWGVRMPGLEYSRMS